MSRELALMGLCQLSGKSGVVNQVFLKNKTPGAMIKFDESIMEYSLWFVPLRSIVTDRFKAKKVKQKMLDDILM